MNRIVLSALAFIAFSAFSPSLQGQEPEFTSPVPVAPGWRAVGPAVVDMPDDLPRVASAIEPLLKAYGFESRTFQSWSGPKGEVKSTVYEMESSAGAYGYYSGWRAGQRDAQGYAQFPFGAEGFRMGDRRTLFWSGRYVVELQGSLKAVTAWSELVAPRTEEPADLPPVVAQLPEEHRVLGSEEYLSSRLDVDWGADPSLFGLDRHAEGARALYRVQGKNVQLVMLMYPTQQLAIQYEEALIGSGSGKGRWKRRVGPIVAVGSGDEAAVASVLASVRHDYEVTWNEAPPELNPENPAVFMVSLFHAIGIVAIVALGAGVILGGIRIYFKWRYPNRVFDRAGEFEMIQLKLNRDFTAPAAKPAEKD